MLVMTDREIRDIFGEMGTQVNAHALCRPVIAIVYSCQHNATRSTCMDALCE
jgi:hypothetical protein